MMEMEMHIVHDVGELEVVKLSGNAILPTKQDVHITSYTLYSPFDFVVKAGRTKSVSTELCVSFQKA